MKNRMNKNMRSRIRVTVSLPSDLVRRLDLYSRAHGASRSGMAERWLRAGERQASLVELERELETYYSRSMDGEEAALGAALGRAARETASEGPSRRPPRRRSSR